MNAPTLYTWFCDAIEIAVVLYMAWNWKEIEARNNKETDKCKLPPISTSSQFPLPLWAETQLRLPNEIVRSALFNARNRKQPRAHLKDAEIAVIGDVHITYTGKELRQDDEAVWLQLIHMANERPLGHVIEFTPYSLCKAIGWSNDSRSYQRLRESLKRMQATSLEISSKETDK